MAHYGDGSQYGAGVHYGTTEGTSAEYLVDVEGQNPQLMVRCSPRIKFTASASTRVTFRVFSLRLLAGLRSQLPDRYQATTDILADRVSPRIKHTGSDFVLSSLRIVAKVTKHQPKG